MHVVRRSLPAGIAVVVFKTLDLMIVSPDILAEQSIQAIRLGLWRAAPFAIVFAAEIVAIAS